MIADSQLGKEVPGALPSLGEGCPAVGAEGIDGGQPGEPAIKTVMSFIQQKFDYVHYIPVPKHMGTSIFRNTFNKKFHGNQKNVC